MILQEYLAKLGWSIDEPSMKKFVGALASTGAKTAELGSLALETAGAIELMVSRVARKYETLYYVSQRTSQSVKYIQGTQFAFKQIGLSAEDANHSIENIAATLRTQPWLKGIFGGASTPQAIAGRLGKSGLPYFLQARFAEMIGMDEKTLLHLQKFEHIEGAARAEMARRQKEAGIDPEKLAEKTAAWGREVNKLESALGVFGDKMASNFIDPMTDGTKRLTGMVEWLTRADSATKGWLGTLIALGGSAGGLFVLEKLLRRIFGLSAATATGGALAAITGGVVGGAAGKQASALKKFMGLAVKKGYVKKGGWIGGAIGALEMIKQDDPEIKSVLREMFGIKEEEGEGQKGKGSAPVGKTPTRTGLKKTQDAAQFFKDAGYPADSAHGIAAGLYSENTAMDPSKVNEIGMTGIAQWDTKRRATFKKMFLKEMKDASFEEQLQFIKWELDNTEKATGDTLKRGGLGGRSAAHKFISGFERPGAAGIASDMSRAGPMVDTLDRLATQQNGAAVGGTTINLTSKTDVHLNGGGDAASTAREYMKAQNEVNGTLVRNVAGAVR